jgi:MFS family permease
VGAIFSIRFVALMLFGIPAGVLADRVDRRRLVIMVSLGGAVVAILLAGLAAAQGGTVGFPMLAAGAFLLGVLDTVRITAGTAYTVDLVGPAVATGAIAVTSLAAQAGNIGGNVAGGVLLRDFGLPV